MRGGIVQQRENPARWSCDEWKYLFQCIINSLCLSHTHTHVNTPVITRRLTSREDAVTLTFPSHVNIGVCEKR